MTTATHERITEVSEQLQGMLEELRSGNRTAPVLSTELDTLQQALMVLERLAKRSKTGKRIPIGALPARPQLDAEESKA